MPRENYEWVVPDEAAIYTRPNSSKYQVRMKAPVKGGYIIKSTGKRDVVEARKHAQKMYYNLLLKIENKEEIKKNPSNNHMTYSGHTIPRPKVYQE